MPATIVFARGGEPFDSTARAAVESTFRGARFVAADDPSALAAALDAAETAVAIVPERPAFSTWRDLLLSIRARRRDAIVVVVLEAVRALGVADAIRAGADDAVSAARLGELDAIVAAARERRARGAERERYQAIAETAADYAYSIRFDGDGRPAPEWVSSGFERLTGFALCEVDLGLGYGGIAHPDDAPALARRETALRAGRPTDETIRVVTRGGEVRFLRDRAQPVLDAGGTRLVRIDGGAADVTAERAGRDVVRALEARLDALLLQMPAGVVIAEAPSGRTIRTNTLAEEIGGGAVPVTGAAGARSLFAKSLRAGEVVTEEEIEVPRADGSVSVIRFSSAPIRDGEGRIVEAIATFSDVTAATQIEKTLLESESMFRTLFDAAAVGIVVTDWDGAVIESNPAFKRMLGLTPEALAGRRFPEFVGLADFQGWRERMRAGRQHAAQFETEYRSANGVVAHLSVTVSLVRPEGEPSAGYAIVFVEDATTRHYAEENMRQAGRQLKLVTDALPVLLSYVGKDERYQFVNKTYEAWHGRRREEILDRRIADLVPPHVYAVLEPYVKMALRGETARFVFRSSLRGDSVRDFDVTYVPDVGAEGEVRGFFVHVADVTVREESLRAKRRLARRLRRERSILAGVLEQCPAGLVVGEAPSGRLVHFNSRLREIIGHEFIPTRDVAAYAQWPGFHPDGRALKPSEWPLARAITNGETVRDEEVHYARPDGTRAVLSLSSRPIRDRRGDIVAAVVAVTEVAPGPKR